MTLWEYEEMARDEGRVEGIAEGLAQGLAQGLINGQARNLVNNVESLEKKLGISTEKACNLIEITVDDYEKAKELLN